jgi:hypothetical protein
VHPKGVPSNSPGLRSYPGNMRENIPNHNVVASNTVSQPEDATYSGSGP